MTTDSAQRIAVHVKDVEEALNTFLVSCQAAVLEASRVIVATFCANGKLLICGNGGSSADSLHMAAELVSSFGLGLRRRALPVIALPANVATITAYANDFDYAGVFERQVEAFGHPGDTLLAISTSGESENVVRAVQTAQRLNLKVVALTGQGPSRLRSMADVVVAVPGSDTQVVQTLHLMVEHLICGYVEEALCDWR